MDFDLSKEQEMLRDSASKFLSAKCPKSLVREMEADEKGHPVALWQEMAQLGWLGLIFPSEYGGSECSFLDQVLFLEETGRACLPGPYFSTVILGGLSILEAGSEEQKGEFLPKISQGQMTVTLALTECTAQYHPAAIGVRAIG